MSYYKEKGHLNQCRWFR